ncbi:MAG: segregation/condensation protein A [Phycisphaerales bacterium]|nr:segregation/condensation protein A [Phycisphaerales bacterium]
MQDYRVELDAFSGPMDLLLFLVKRDEVDLRDIPVARLTEQYLAYLKQLEAIDVNLAGEFLVMAATLLELKSQMLVPQAPAAEGDGENNTTNLAELDPRRELVTALLAYKRFKDSARLLEQRAEVWAQRYPRNPVRPKVVIPNFEDESQQALWDAVDGQAPAVDDSAVGEAVGAEQQEYDIEDANVLDLAEMFTRVMESIGRSAAHHEVLYDDTPIGLHADDILDRLQREATLTLQNVFEGRSRGERIGLFLALLELVRQRKIVVKQEDLNLPIELSLRPATMEMTLHCLIVNWPTHLQKQPHRLLTTGPR